MVKRFIYEDEDEFTSVSYINEVRRCMTDPNVVEHAVQAYIIPNHDSHGSEYLTDADKRLEFISGFSGSAGTAIISIDDALLWTDPRYFLQALEELDEEWTLMKTGTAGCLNEAEWLAAALPKGSYVGGDGDLIPYPLWESLQAHLAKYNIKLISLQTNIVDLLWIDRPCRSLKRIKPHTLPYAGVSAADKIANVIEKLKDNKAEMLILTALDDIAWLLNLRGEDIPFNPVFFAFVVVTLTELNIFIDEKQVILPLRNHLRDLNIVIHKYENVKCFIKHKASSKSVKQVWIPTNTNFNFYKEVPSGKRFCEASPVAKMKAIKNDAEIFGMYIAHLKDGVALCQLFNWLQDEISEGPTEMDVSEKLERFRKLEDFYCGPSFETISASGPHSAITHYRPTKKTNSILTRNEIFLLDSGAQYPDGTTDVTRTVHYGEPDIIMKEAYTRVLKGLASIGSSVFPSGIKGNYLDSFARRYLWEVGLDYGHGTGHGIGSYLHVHEGPMGISWRPYPEDPGLQENMFLSNEPGFYDDNNFGIRIENVVQVIKANTPYHYQEKDFLRFFTVTKCPIQTKMVVPSMLTDEELRFLNVYNIDVLNKLKPILEKRDHLETLDWLSKETEPLTRE